MARDDDDQPRMRGPGWQGCEYCDDTGYVLLNRVVEIGGVKYDSWAAPCRWCQHGTRAAVAQVVEGFRPETEFDEDDIVPPPASGKPITFSQYLRTEAGENDPHAQAIMARLEAAKEQPRVPAPFVGAEPPPPADDDIPF